MDIVKIKEVLTVICILLFSLSLACLLVRFIRLEIRNARNSKAPVCTERATVYCKHAEQDYLPQGRSSGAVFYITFHTDLGQIVKCHMDYEHFYQIEEDATGQLTWQGERFWRFIPEKKGASL